MWPFSGKANPQAAESAAITALRCQVSNLESQCAKEGRDVSELLESPSALLLLFGFVDYYCLQYRVTKRKERVDLAISVFRAVFGDRQGIRMFGALQPSLRTKDAELWCKEGFNAASEFEANGLQLIDAFFEGVFRQKSWGKLS